MFRCCFWMSTGPEPLAIENRKLICSGRPRCYIQSRQLNLGSVKRVACKILPGVQARHPRQQFVNGCLVPISTLTGMVYEWLVLARHLQSVSSKHGRGFGS